MSQFIPWIALVFPAISTLALIWAGAAAYGAMKQRVDTHAKEIKELKHELATKADKAAIAEIKDLVDRAVASINTRLEDFMRYFAPTHKS